MALGDFLFGSPQRTEQLQRFGPQQQQGLSQLISRLQGNLQSPTAGFEPIAQQARTQFETKTIPSLAERFTSLGSGGSQRSSAFQGAIGQAGAGLEEGLASLKSQYGLQRESQLEQLLSSLLTTPQFETISSPETKGLTGGIGDLLLALAPLLFASGAGAPAAIAAGGAGAGLGALSSYLRG